MESVSVRVPPRTVAFIYSITSAAAKHTVTLLIQLKWTGNGIITRQADETRRSGNTKSADFTVGGKKQSMSSIKRWEWPEGRCWQRHTEQRNALPAQPPRRSKQKAQRHSEGGPLGLTLTSASRHTDVTAAPLPLSAAADIPCTFSGILFCHWPFPSLPHVFPFWYSSFTWFDVSEQTELIRTPWVGMESEALSSGTS